MPRFATNAATIAFEPPDADMVFSSASPLLEVVRTPVASAIVPATPRRNVCPRAERRPDVPELPEVETIRRQLALTLPGRTVVDSWAFDHPKFTPASESVGGHIHEVRRRGKYLLIEITRPDGPHELIIHLGMTGQLRTEAAEPGGVGGGPRDPYDRARFELDDGTVLAYRDVRRFGRIAWTPRGHYDDHPTLAALGPEPFDHALDGAALWAALRGSRRAVKTQLLSQRPVAGVGNIYADEALWIARVRPAARTVTRPQAVRLLEAIRSVLSAGIEHGGTTLRDYVDAQGRSGENQHHLICYGRGGKPCIRCGEPLRHGVLDGRGTTWCRTCQR